MSDNKPVRCFEGTAKPYERFWTFKNVAGPGGVADGAVELELYGVISEYSWLGDEITPQLFKSDLTVKGQGRPVTVRINSYGGDIIAASLIRAALMDYPGEVTARIDGVAASAAVAVALAAKNILIQDTAYMMIHNPYLVYMGALDETNLRLYADEVATLKAGIVDTYAARTGMSAAKISTMMDNETWMSAKEAVKFGFADQVITATKADNSGINRAQNMAFINALRNFDNVPAALLESVQPDLEPSDAERYLRDEIYFLRR